jgi:hypothetical protein
MIGIGTFRHVTRRHANAPRRRSDYPLAGRGSRDSAKSAPAFLQPRWRGSTRSAARWPSTTTSCLCPAGRKSSAFATIRSRANIFSSRTRFCRSTWGRPSRAISSATRRPFSARETIRFPSTCRPRRDRQVSGSRVRERGSWGWGKCRERFQQTRTTSIESKAPSLSMRSERCPTPTAQWCAGPCSFHRSTKARAPMGKR